MSPEEIEKLVDSLVAQKVAALEASFDERIHSAISASVYRPRLPAMNADAAPFMPFSSCSTADFLHPSYKEWCARIGSAPVMHRKMWEWVFVLQHLDKAGMLRAGRRGICFGVGQESLPAYIAGRGAGVMATDAPPSIGEASGWLQTGQYTESLESLNHPYLCAAEDFQRLVQFRYCDMTAIDPEFSGFDFAWSSCCFEHLGSLEAGMAFVVDSVEKCLRVGGIAVHTTELNLSSDEQTLAEGGTVLYRHKDIVELVERLRTRGHDVQPFLQAPDNHVLDFHVDAPPYSKEPHLKIQLGGYVTTSVGIVVRRGVGLE